MKSLKLIIKTAILCAILISCTVEKSDILYGSDACYFCKMNIVDNQHAAEIVTNKGKAVKYDAIECMLADIKKRNDEEIGLFLMTDYSSPGNLVDATSAYYLISENLPSPMGANLSGFADRDSAERMKDNRGGKIYSWTELKKLF